MSELRLYRLDEAGFSQGGHAIHSRQSPIYNISYGITGSTM